MTKRERRKHGDLVAVLSKVRAEDLSAFQNLSEKLCYRTDPQRISLLQFVRETLLSD